MTPTTTMSAATPKEIPPMAITVMRFRNRVWLRALRYLEAR
jgi:hypothetical protein